jgi:hypothetical protein
VRCRLRHPRVENETELGELIEGAIDARDTGRALSRDQPVVDLLRARAAGLGGEHVNDGVARSFCLASELTELGVRFFGPHDH